MIKLIDLEVYKVALEIGDNIWDIVDKWDFFNKGTIGKQFVKSRGFNCIKYCRRLWQVFL
jgi:hypothetical protein